MIKKIVFINIALLFSFAACFAQGTIKSLNGFWLNKMEQSVIEYYDNGEYYSFLFSRKRNSFSGGKNKTQIGFQDSCNINLNNIKDSGQYYFEYDMSDFNDAGEPRSPIFCLELNIFKVGDSTFMNIYNSARQQYVTYVKLDRLPLKLVEYIENKKKNIYLDYKRISAPTPSYNCALAGTPIEKAICNNWELSQLDRDLSKAYNKLEKTEKLRANQNKWLSKRNKLKGTEEELIKKLIAMYKKRILELK